MVACSLISFLGWLALEVSEPPGRVAGVGWWKRMDVYDEELLSKASGRATECRIEQEDDGRYAWTIETLL